MDFSKIGIVVKKADEHDVRVMCRDIRQQDRAELASWSDVPLGKELASYILTDDPSWAVYTSEGELLSLFGLCVPAGWEEKNIVNIWMVSCNAVDRNKKRFLRGCRACLDMGSRLIDKGKILVAYTIETYTQAVRWMKWLGFKDNGARVYGVDNSPFIIFMKRVD